MPSAAASEGAGLLRMGLLREAARVFSRGLEEDGEDLPCLLGLARALLGQRKDAEARPHLERLLSLQPHHTEALSHLTRLRAEAGEPGALETLRALAASEGAGFSEHYPELEKVSGRYFGPDGRTEAKSSAKSHDAAVARRLWEVSEQLTRRAHKSAA
jgi:uncharacterized protein HemY